MEMTKVYKLRIEMHGSNPIIFRTVTMPCTALFEDLHTVIQTIFGWMDYHQYQFDLDDKKIHILPFEDKNQAGDGYANKVAGETTLFEHLNKGYKFDYIYDMGDYWIHNVIVEDEMEQEEEFPKLLEFQGDNLAEDAGGIQGYYEKLSHVEKNDHPDVDIRDWFEMQHIDFDEEEIQEELEMTFVDAPYYYDEDETMDEGMENLEELFELVIDDALIRLHTNMKIYYLWFHIGNTKSVHIFEDEENCKMASLLNMDRPLPLYYEGIKIKCQDYDELEEYESLEESDFMPEFVRIGDKRTFEQLDDEELEEILKIFNDLVMIKPEIEEKVEFLPSILDESMCLDVTISENEKEILELKEFEFKPNLPEFRITEQEKESINTKVNTDRIKCCILPVQNLLDFELKQEAVYYYLIQGKKIKEKIKLSGVRLEEVVDGIKSFWLTYLEKNGCPKQVISDDNVLIAMMGDFFASLKIDFKTTDNLTKEFIDLYQQAFFEVNNEELIDQAFMKLLLDLDEDSFGEFLEKSEEKDVEKFFRYAAFLNTFEKTE